MDHPLEFAMLLRALLDSSSPATRVERHLLHLDVHDTYEFVRLHPDALAIGEVRPHG